ncbi:MAG: DUF459 domain-containing protein [Alphaproteobacteria bacterium]|nr:DUF459 domain-containing protein [Alphaproteobacteria bacterium]
MTLRTSLALLVLLALPGGGARACEVEAGAPDAPARTQVAVPETALLVGSSSFEWGLGPALARQLEDVGVRQVINAGRRSTGLARLDFHDWLAEAEALVQAHHPGLVVVQLGGNDAQHLRSPTGRRVADWGSDDWTETYANRVRSLLAILGREGAPVAIVGLSHPEEPGYARKVATINALWSVVAAERGAWFLGTWDLTSAPDGAPLIHRDVGGRLRRVRGDDGIHLTSTVAAWVAAELGRELARHLDRKAACALDPVAELPSTPADAP